MKDQEEIEGQITDAIDAFNAYRAPEARARLLSLVGNIIRVEFSGCFCGTCGFYVYFEDLRIEFEENGVRTALERVTETESGAVVEYGMELH
jgi:hypothetical protein